MAGGTIVKYKGISRPGYLRLKPQSRDFRPGGRDFIYFTSKRKFPYETLSGRQRPSGNNQVIMCNVQPHAMPCKMRWGMGGCAGISYYKGMYV